MTTDGIDGDGRAASPRRLPRAQRREQLLTAATGAFVRAGYTSTSLKDVAEAAGVTRAILYRHFASKADLFTSALEQARAHLHTAVGDGPYTEQIIDDLLAAAAGDPDAFRLLFVQAPREPGFRAHADAYTEQMSAAAHRELAARIPDGRWATWASQLAPTVTVAAILAWLDAGQPDPDTAPARIRTAVAAIPRAAGQPPSA